MEKRVDGFRRKHQVDGRFLRLSLGSANLTNTCHPWDQIAPRNLPDIAPKKKGGQQSSRSGQFRLFSPVRFLAQASFAGTTIPGIKE